MHKTNCTKSHSRRVYENLNRIEDQIDTLLQAVYEFNVDEVNIKLLEEFSDLIKNMNGGFIETRIKLQSIIRIKKIFDSIEKINPLILSYFKIWLRVIYIRINKMQPDMVADIVENYISTSGKNDIVEFYFYVLREFYTNIEGSVYD